MRNGRLFRIRLAALALVLSCGIGLGVSAPQDGTRQITGVVSTSNGQTLSRMLVIVTGFGFERQTQTGDRGQFSISVPDEDVVLKVEGPYVSPNEKIIRRSDRASDLQIHIGLSIPPIHKDLVIVANALQPTVDTYTADIYRKTLFARDDQL